MSSTTNNIYYTISVSLEGEWVEQVVTESMPLSDVEKLACALQVINPVHEIDIWEGNGISAGDGSELKYLSSL